MGAKITNIIGCKFSLLTVIKEAKPFLQPSGQSQRAFMCLCDCGKKKRVRMSHLRMGRVSSCGHLVGELHGMTGTILHNTWRGMKNRCYGKGYSEPQYYQQKNITVHKDWINSFKRFKKWADKNGFKEGLTIDRIDNDKGYSPKNCRFITQAENNCNRINTIFVIHNGEKVSLTLLIKSLGKDKDRPTIMSRISRGWDYLEAINKPIRILRGVND